LKRTVLAITDEAVRLGKLISERLPETRLKRCRGDTADAIRQSWAGSEALICIMATGIAVRAIAPLLEDKRQDPAVLVLDQKGDFVIPLVSGHLGGANSLAVRVAEITGGQAVITTASDVSGHTALDLWIRRFQLRAASPEKMPAIMGRLVDRGFLKIYSDSGLPDLPGDILPTDTIKDADILVTARRTGSFEDLPGHLLLLHPPALVVGIGCNRGASAGQIARAVERTCCRFGLARQAIFRVATIDIKRDEKGLLDFARAENLQISFYSARDLDRVPGIQASETVRMATGARGVCEPAAILAAGNGPLIVEKQRWKDVTTAIARASWPWWEQARGR
jgi:cobalt-precorrin 5A hydrolase